jgi:hypothetical protein
LLLVLSIATAASAHPVLLDRIDARVRDDCLIVDVHATLRTATLVAHDSKPEHTATEIEALVRDAAPYLASHLDVSTDARSLVSLVSGASIEEPIDAGVTELDLERGHAVTHLTYALPPHEGGLTLVFTSRVLDEVEGWDETFAVVLSTDEGHTASGVLHRGKPLTLHVTSPSSPQPKSSSAWHWALAAIMATAVIFVAAWRRRTASTPS